MISKEKIVNGIISAKNKVVDAVCNFFSKLLSFLKKAINLVERKTHLAVVGVSTYLKKIEDKVYEQRIKNYSVNEIGKWKETIVTVKQNEEEVPEKYRQYEVMDDEFDISDDLEMMLA